MTARRRTGGGLPVSRGAPAPGGDRRNLHIAFEWLSASAPTARPDLQAAGATFKFGDLLQAVSDVTALIFIALLLAVTAISVPVTLFILLFVRVH